MDEANQRASGVNETTRGDAGLAYEVASAQKDAYESGVRRAQQYGEAKDQEQRLADGSVEAEGVFSRAEQIDLARGNADAQRGYARDDFLEARHQAETAISEETSRRKQEEEKKRVQQLRTEDGRGLADPSP